MRPLFLILTVVILLTSCEKSSPGTIKEMVISGLVFDSTHHAGAANVQVNAYWRSTGTNTHIDQTTTDAQGKFRLKLTVDTSRFEQEDIIVSLFAPGNYISFGHPQVQETTPISHYAAEVPLQRFVLFEKTHLTITLRRTQADTIEDFTSAYSFFAGDAQSLLQFNSSVPTPLYISYLDKETAAGVYTKVSWTKKLTSGAIITYQDSILCAAGSFNSILLHF